MILTILAAGGSQRFGEQNKLAAELDGKMLGLHVAEALAGAEFVSKFIVTTGDHPCSAAWSDLGYQLLINGRAGDGQATSVAIAAEIANSEQADALCICLADMPFVSTEHLKVLKDRFVQLDAAHIVASSDGKKPMPPAIFPAWCFEQLSKLEGDEGARALLSDAMTIDVKEPILMDIDCKNDLAEAEKYIQQ